MDGFGSARYREHVRPFRLGKRSALGIGLAAALMGYIVGSTRPANADEQINPDAYMNAPLQMHQSEQDGVSIVTPFGHDASQYPMQRVYSDADVEYEMPLRMGDFAAQSIDDFVSEAYTARRVDKQMGMPIVLTDPHRFAEMYTSADNVEQIRDALELITSAEYDTTNAVHLHNALEFFYDTPLVVYAHEEGAQDGAGDTVGVAFAQHPPSDTKYPRVVHVWNDKEYGDADPRVGFAAQLLEEMLHTYFYAQHDEIAEREAPHLVGDYSGTHPLSEMVIKGMLRDFYDSPAVNELDPDGKYMNALLAGQPYIGAFTGNERRARSVGGLVESLREEN